MTVDWIKTDESKLQRDQELFEVYLQEFQKSWQQMVERMNELNTTWTGPAKNIFSQQFEIDNALLKEAYEKLKEMSEAMKAAAKEYEGCDSKVASIIASILI